MLQIVGGPELLYNDTLLDEYYKDVSSNNRLSEKFLFLAFLEQKRHLCQTRGKSFAV
jgi:hypothetical protein